MNEQLLLEKYKHLKIERCGKGYSFYIGYKEYYAHGESYQQVDKLINDIIYESHNQTNPTD